MNAPIVYSWGYLGRSPNELAALVERLGATVIDTRFRPWSRTPEWNATRLRQRLGSARYVHLIEFGNLRWQETAADAVQLVNVERGLELVAPILAKGPVLLLCLEREHAACHRKVVADAIVARFGARIILLETEENEPEQMRVL